MTTCSAPGKILLAGGYLVLDQDYTGLVLSLSARIYTTVQTYSTHENLITVKSPQFQDAVWTFQNSAEGLVSLNTDKNVFVREALHVIITYFSLTTKPVSLDIMIHADNQYYSLPEATSRFATSNETISNTPKTGLGSSAALVTSLCAALFLHFSDDIGKDVSNDQNIVTIHNLAQIAHCRAQGKVGSGFDVASAVYGSCNYSRFDPKLIDNLPSTLTTPILQNVVNSQWPMTIQKVKLRTGLKLLMGDVSQGSSTPGMVKKVLASSSALDVWPSLGISNDLLSEYLTAEQPYDLQEQSRIVEMTRSVRGLLKQMGIEAKVEIEPDEQTRVLDQTLALNGVVACGVPGAGGFDAIFAVVDTAANAEEKVRYLWKNQGIQTLDVRDDGEGIKVEQNFQSQ